MSITQFSDEVAKKVQMITRHEGEKILRSNSADFAGQAPTDPTPQQSKVLDDFAKRAGIASHLSLKNRNNLNFQAG